MGEFVGVALFAMMIFMVLLCFDSPKTYKPDPDENKQMEIARSILEGKTTPEEVAEKEGYDIEHIKKWKAKYADMLVGYGLHAIEHSIVKDDKDGEIRWFQDAMKKQFGDNWKEKTGYNEREVMKYKKDEPPKK